MRSLHIEQVCLDLKIRLIFSTIGEPRGRGKIERFFRTVNQLLLAKLPGYAPLGHKSPNPVLNFDRLDSEFERFLIGYHQTEHSQTSEAPQKRWNGKGFLPQLPESSVQIYLPKPLASKKFRLLATKDANNSSSRLKTEYPLLMP